MSGELTNVTFYDPDCWVCGADSNDVTWVTVGDETRVRACNDCKPNTDQ